MRYILLIVGMLLAGIAPAFASIQQNVHDPSYKIALGAEMPGVRVDWPRQAIFIITEVKAPTLAMGRRAYQAALKIALDAARKQVNEGIIGLKLTSYATVKDAVAAFVLPEDSLYEIGKPVRPVADTWDTGDKILRLLSVLPLVGSYSPGALAARMLKIEQQTFAGDAVAPIRAKETIMLRPREEVAQISNGPYTGLIVDCSGLRFTPALLTKFVAEDGAEFWGTAGVNRLLVMEKGMFGVSADLKSALNADRVGATPLIIRPLGIAGVLRGDLVFSADAAKLITDQDAISHFLAPLSIVLVID